MSDISSHRMVYFSQGLSPAEPHRSAVVSCVLEGHSVPRLPCCNEPMMKMSARFFHFSFLIANKQLDANKHLSKG